MNDIQQRNKPDRPDPAFITVPAVALIKRIRPGVIHTPQQDSLVAVLRSLRQ